MEINKILKSFRMWNRQIETREDKVRGDWILKSFRMWNVQIETTEDKVRRDWMMRKEVIFHNNVMVFA